MKYLRFLILFGLVWVWIAGALITQAQAQVLLLPPQYLIIEPASGSQSRFGENDLTISVSGFNLLKNGAKCDLTIRQVKTDGVVVVNNVNQTYSNGVCKMVMAKDQQVGNELEITLRVVDTDQKIYGLDFKYFFTAGSDLFIDPNAYTLPDVSLYTRPEVQVTVKDKGLEVGEVTTVQYSFRNIDTFAIKDFEIQSNLSQNAKIVCDSFNFTDKPLDGFTVYNPFSPIKLLAAEGNSAGCDGDLKFKANIKDIKVGQVTRLNFDIEVTAPGELSFDILTNLDQGKITYDSKPILVIDSASKSTEIRGFEGVNTIWIYVSVGISVAVIAGGVIYYIWRRKKKSQNSSL